MLFSHVLFCVKKTYIQGRWAPWSTDLPARITFTVIKSITKCLLTLIVLLTMYFNWNILIYIMSMVMSIKQLITLKTGKLITNIYLRKSSSTNWCFTYSITGSRLPCGSHIVKLSYLKTKNMETTRADALSFRRPGRKTVHEFIPCNHYEYDTTCSLYKPVLPVSWLLLLYFILIYTKLMKKERE